MLKKEPANNYKLFKYCGVWEPLKEDQSVLGGYWNTKYVEVDFTGKQIIIHIPKKCEFKIRIDDGEYTNYIEFEGDYVVNVDNDIKHTLRIYNNTYKSDVYFGGVSVPDGSTLSRTANKKHYIQFIGDSITHMGSLHNAGEDLNWDYSIQALNGMTLCTRKNRIFKELCPKIYKHFGEKKPGMDVSYYRTQYTRGDIFEVFSDFLDDDSKHKYNFLTGYAPDIIYIFLGTNDTLDDNPHDVEFIETYRNFVDGLYNLYGDNLNIILMNSIYKNYDSNRHINIATAAKLISEDHPDKVHFIDIPLLKEWDIDNSDDGCHPNPNEYIRLASLMTEYLDNEFNEINTPPY